MEFACPCFASCIWHLDAYKILIASTPTPALFFKKLFNCSLERVKYSPDVKSPRPAQAFSLKSVQNTIYNETDVFFVSRPPPQCFENVISIFKPKYKIT